MAVPPALQNRITEAFGLSGSKLALDEAQMQLSSSATLLPFHRVLISDPFQSIDATNRIADFFNQTPLDLQAMVINGSLFINSRAGFIPKSSMEPAPWTAEQFSEQCKFLFQGISDKSFPQWQESAQAFYNALPSSLQIILADFIKNLFLAMPWLNGLQDQEGRAATVENLLPLISSDSMTPVQLHQFEQSIRVIDRTAIYRGGAQMCTFLNNIIQNTSAPMDFPFPNKLTWSTPLGDILIAGNGNDSYQLDKPPLLLIDCGGNDYYSGVYAQTSKSSPCSIILDLAGNDIYISSESSLGNVSALLGIAALIDLSSERDQFTGQERCFGYSCCGVSILYEESGNTTYNTRALSLGAAEMGISIFVDDGGDDTYYSIYDSQAYGSLGGFGLLYDRMGNDTYIASATPAIHPSAQIQDVNYSASQGFGEGRFGPLEDGHSFPGGIGFLLDAQGNDSYQASVFAQGSGYGFGIGILADLDGDDQYSTRWYGMGAAAHQGCGFFIDRKGNDHYTATHYMVGGAATDFSLAGFYDGQGNDDYSAKNASLGYSLVNSFALFLDEQGDDHYHLSDGLGLGQASNEASQTLRGLWSTVGIYLDTAGQDQYNAGANDQNNKQWLHTDTQNHTYSIGLDENS